jgi:Uma2 family endonuclease
VPHVFTQNRLSRILNMFAPSGLVAVGEGAGVSVRDGASYFVPDLLVVPARAMKADEVYLDPAHVLLAVEVLSDTHRGIDLLIKRSEYAEAGIPSYWIVDREERRLTALTLDSDAKEYREEAVVEAGRPWTARQPFEVMIDPADFC